VPSDVAAVAECLLRLSQLACEHAQTKELDVNPLIVYPRGQGAVMADARIILGPGAGAEQDRPGEAVPRWWVTDRPGASMIRADDVQDMNALVEAKRVELNELCMRCSVLRLELFGSAAVGTRFDSETSDLDFLVEFLPVPEGKYFDTYFSLLEGLENLFRRPVNLVILGAIRNPYFLQAVNQSRTLLYAA